MNLEMFPCQKEAGESAMEEVFEIAQTKRLSDKQNYLLSWLTASSSQMRSAEVDTDKRVETVLSVLHKDRSRNVIPFKLRPKK